MPKTLGLFLINPPGWLAYLALLGFCIPSQGQEPINIASNPAIAPAAGPFEYVTGEIYLTHVLADTVVYRWTRTVLQFQGGAECVSAVSDKNITYIPPLNSYTFELGPNEAGFPLFVHLINQDTIPCCALIHLSIHLEGDTTNAMTAAYIFGECSTSTTEPNPPTTMIQPNPVSQSFSIPGKKAGTIVQLFDLNGRLIQRWKPGVETYQVPLLEQGRYFLVLLDKYGAPYRALILLKN